MKNRIRSALNRELQSIHVDDDLKNRILAEAAGERMSAQRKKLPFLPVARRYDGETPVCLEDGPEEAETLAGAIAGLSLKGLIRLDYDLPLSNYDYREYEDYPCRGSMALTARGQAVVELLEIQGVSE